MVLLLAFSLQDQVVKYGSYVGIAAFFGLAVLVILYFAQARELKRLREWAGRAPERAQELEARILRSADDSRPGALGENPRPGERPPSRPGHSRSCPGPRSAGDRGRSRRCGRSGSHGDRTRGPPRPPRPGGGQAHRRRGEGAGG